MEHISVLRDESIQALNINPEGIYIDATMGGGGHSEEICKRLKENGTFIGIDQDDYAQQVAQERLKDYPCEKIFVRDNFSNLKEILNEYQIDHIDGILFDLGVSSFQFDDDSRGFSYHNNGPLDMRMDRSQSFSARDIINDYSKEDLIAIFKDYGEEKFAGRIASKIIETRKDHPIETTLELSELIKSAYPAKLRYKGKHPARKVFQALRIEVNKELSILPDTFQVAVEFLKPGGRLAIISFHSLEDRIVKQFIRNKEKESQDSSGLPVKTASKRRELKRVNRKPIVPDERELALNNRARSAKLRVAEKL